MLGVDEMIRWLIKDSQQYEFGLLYAFYCLQVVGGLISGCFLLVRYKNIFFLLKRFCFLNNISHFCPQNTLT